MDIIRIIGTVIIVCVYHDGSEFMAGESMRDIARIVKEFEAADEKWPGRFKIPPYIDGTFITIKRIPVDQCTAKVG